MTISLPFGHANYLPLIELLRSIGSNPSDEWKLRPADQSHAVYVPAGRISAVEDRFIADGNATLLRVEKLPVGKPTNPVGGKQSKKR